MKLISTFFCTLVMLASFCALAHADTITAYVDSIAHDSYIMPVSGGPTYFYPYADYGDPADQSVRFGKGSYPMHAHFTFDISDAAADSIESATLRLYCLETRAKTIDVRFYGYDADSTIAVTDTTSFYTVLGNLTTAYKDTSVYYPYADTWYEFDVTSVVQELSERPGWTGHTIIVAVDDTSETSGYFRAEAAEDLSSHQAQLVVVHSEQQEGSGSGAIAGTVQSIHDSTSIVGATVTVTPGNYTDTTDGSGNYFISDIPDSITYSISVTKSGFQEGTASNISVSDNDTTVVDFFLTSSDSTTLSTQSIASSNGYIMHVGGTSYYYPYTESGDPVIKSVRTGMGSYPMDAYFTFDISDAADAGSIESAILKLYCRETRAKTVDMLIYAYDADSSVTINDATTFLAVLDTLTSTATDTSLYYPTENTWYEFDVTSVIAELLNRESWTGHTTIVVKDDNSESSGYLRAEATEDTGTNAAQLDVSYSTVVETGAIAGIITDIGDSTAIEGASISITPGDYTTTTDEFGNYIISSIPVYSSYLVSVSATYYQNNSQTNVSVVADDTTTVDIELSPVPPGYIAGTVISDSDSSAIQGAIITVTPGDYTDTTDENGEYSIEVPMGGYAVSVTATGYNGDSEPQVSVPSNYTQTINFELSPVPPGYIAGTVVSDSDSSAIQGAIITVTPGDYTDTTDENGEYSIEVPMGGYAVSVTATGYNDDSEPQVSVPSNYTQTINFELSQLSSAIAGVIKSVTDSTSLQGVIVQVSPGNCADTTDVNGAYIISDIPAGNYSLSANKEYYLEENLSNITVSLDDTTDVNDIYLTGVGAIAGFIKDNTDTNIVIQNAYISVTPGDYADTTDAYGYYILTDIPVDETYQVSVTAHGYLNNSQSDITVSTAQVSWVDMKISSATGTIAGTVSDSLNSVLLEGITVSVFPGGYTGITNSSGQYSITDVPVGTDYSISVRPYRYQDAKETQKTVSNNSTTTVNFELSPIMAKFGIFGLVNNGTTPYAGTTELRNEIALLDSSGIQYFQEYYNRDALWFYTYFSDLNTVSNDCGRELKTLVSAQFSRFDGWFDPENDTDGIIDNDELARYISYVDSICKAPHSDHILGWYISDEPDVNSSEFGTDIPPDSPSELKKLYDVIDSLDTDNRPVYVVISGSHPVGHDFTKYEDCFDVMIIDYYGFTGSFDSNEAYNNDKFYGTMKTWTSMLNEAREDLAGKNKEIQALIYLEQTYNNNDDNVVAATHWQTHSVVRRLMDLGIDTIWSYWWQGAQYTWTQDDSTGYKSTDYGYVFHDEVDDVEHLVTAFSNEYYTQSALYVSDVPNHNPAWGIEWSYMASSPEYNPFYITALASGDMIAGDNTTHYNGRIDNGFTDSFTLSPSDTTWYGNRYTSDGDDDLIIGFGGYEVVNQEKIKYGNDKEDSDWYAENYSAICDSVIAMTTGDFDGDGDHELVFAVKDDDACKIYLNHDLRFIYVAQDTNYTVTLLHTSTDYHVTALTAGDFDGIGRDYLVTARSNSDYSVNEIFVADIGDREAVIDGTSDYNNNDYYVTAMSAGYLTGPTDTYQKLVVALSDGSNDNGILLADIKEGSYDDAMDDDALIHYQGSSSFRVTAMTAIDRYTHEAKHSVYFGVHSSSDSSYIYETNFFNFPTVPFIERYAGDYYHVTAMSAASFEESLEDGGIYKVALGGNAKQHEESEIAVESPQPIQNTVAISPNPFNPATTIHYTLSEDSQVKLIIYSITGQKVMTLVDDFKMAGSHSVLFNATGLSSGIYIYRLEGNNFFKTGKMLLVK